jgi:signal transduction histidine kinase
MIVEQSGRLARIVDEILLTQQLDSGNLPLTRTSFDVTTLVERVAAGTLTWRNTHPVRLDVSGHLEAEGDPQMFEQALVSLLDNAMKYSPEGTQVAVRVELHRANVRVTVADEGPGIDDADRGRIFEKFFRVDPAQLTGTAGTGLGLYIARELMRRMHGRIGLLPSDRGAAFFLDLTLSRPGPARPPVTG